MFTVHRLDLECKLADAPALTSVIQQFGISALLTEETKNSRCRLRVYFDEGADLAQLAALYEQHGSPDSDGLEADLAAIFEALKEPMDVGTRFVLVPPGAARPAVSTRIPLDILIGSAFGSGSHPTTQLCLALLERSMRPRSTILDLGTGSGILSVAASKLGATRVLAGDLDRGAVSAAAENFVHSGAAVMVFQGTLDCVRTGSVDLLVSNLCLYALQPVVPKFPRVLRQEAEVIVSGFTCKWRAEVIELLGASRLQVVEQVMKGEWVGLRCRNDGAPGA